VPKIWKIIEYPKSTLGSHVQMVDMLDKNLLLLLQIVILFVFRDVEDVYVPFVETYS